MSDFLSVCFSIGIILLEQFIFFVLWSAILQIKQKKPWTYILIFTMLVCVTFITNMFINNANIKLIMFLGLLFAILRLFYKNKWYVLLFCSTLGIVYLKAVDNIILYLSTLILDITPQMSLENPYTFVLFALLSKLIEFIGAWAFAKFTSRYWAKNSSHWKSWIHTLPLPMATCVFLIVAIKLSFVQPDEAPILFLLGCVFMCLCIFQLFIANRLDKQRQSEEENRILQQTLETQKENLQLLTEAYTTHRSLTHEFKNNLDIIASLAQQNKLQELRAHLDEIHENTQITTFVVHTGNSVLDAVLNQKYRIAENCDVTLVFDMTNLKDISLKNDELAVVISNLLDNAIEACTKYDGCRVINLKMKISESQLLIKMTNPTLIPPKIIDGRWMTSKNDNLVHGFGMCNIENILNSFGADYTSEFENEKFSFVAFIPL